MSYRIQCQHWAGLEVLVPFIFRHSPSSVGRDFFLTFRFGLVGVDTGLSRVRLFNILCADSADSCGSMGCFGASTPSGGGWSSSGCAWVGTGTGVVCCNGRINSVATATGSLCVSRTGGETADRAGWSVLSCPPSHFAGVFPKKAWRGWHYCPGDDTTRGWWFPGQRRAQPGRRRGNLWRQLVWYTQ